MYACVVSWGPCGVRGQFVEVSYLLPRGDQGFSSSCQQELWPAERKQHSHSCQQLRLQLLVFYHLPKKWLWGTDQFDWFGKGSWLCEQFGYLQNMFMSTFYFFFNSKHFKNLDFSLVMWCWQSIHLSFYTVLSCIPGPYFPNKEIIDWIHFVIDHLRKIKVLSSADRI